jgi:hypothetical protein
MKSKAIFDYFSEMPKEKFPSMMKNNNLIDQFAINNHRPISLPNRLINLKFQ